MSTEATGITHVSDTALLVAGCRAVESERADAFVRDPFAVRLAGERGMAMFRALPHPEMMEFGIAIRSRFLDELLMRGLAAGNVSTVVCMGAGLDTRPWRLDLPPELRWIEVDFPAMLDYKDAFMAAETPRCKRERLTADLNDAAQRRAVYGAVGREPALLITEGLLMYLPGGTVEALASEVGKESGIAQWIIDITTSSFSKALGGSTASSVRHVQATDCLEGEEILATICGHGWATAERRSYITDLDFAKERIAQMMARMPEPPSPPPFAKDDPTGVHRFARA
ncbi:MAG TPA: SAM-dependent methyltransferase [Bryobacteraceae bacterium]|nr:SAM-dependent methyltransferase [Bryobacteraceae bacterium]